MDPRAQAWFASATSAADHWTLDRVLADKAATGQRVSVIIPARNEQATIADVVGGIRADLVDNAGLVDELIVMDSLSTDATTERAAAAGAKVHGVDTVLPEQGVRKGKGEALWKSLFVATGDIVVFVDADLTEWSTHFVTALAGPLLADANVQLVKGFYDRVLEMDDGPTTQGGRVTELVARPVLALQWPALSTVVQPLAGEWAARRAHMASLPVPVGYGVELASLIDTVSRLGLSALAQVDLGRRAHKHQSVHDLGVMATEILAVAARRRSHGAAEESETAELLQYLRDGGWHAREVPVGERPPANTLAEYRA